MKNINSVKRKAPLERSITVSKINSNTSKYNTFYYLTINFLKFLHILRFAIIIFTQKTKNSPK